MKTRLGFVSNSSSSSFTCDVCGHDQSGWDLCLSDIEMFECENGHVVCAGHAIGNLSEELENSRGHYDVDPSFCPLCQFKDILSSDLAAFLMMQYGLKYSDIASQIKTQFKDYEEFAQTVRKYRTENA